MKIGDKTKFGKIFGIIYLTKWYYFCMKKGVVSLVLANALKENL
jgi:hypothetical protein